MLKKIALVIAFTMLLGSQAFAISYVELTSLAGGRSAQPGVTFKASNNVKLVYGSDLAAKAQAYTLGAKHISGNRTFSTSNLSTAIYYKEDTTVKEGVSLIGNESILPTNAGESLYGAGWTGM
jgi:hypothetical protein